MGGGLKEEEEAKRRAFIVEKLRQVQRESKTHTEKKSVFGVAVSSIYPSGKQMQRLDNTLVSCGGMECAYKELVMFLSPNGADLVACQPSSIAPLALHFVLGTG